MEELPTHDGGGHRVLSTMAELVNHGLNNEEEEATINVYQTTQSMDNMHLGFRVIL